MILRYPNARLFLHDLLCRERLSGAQALAAGACCYELIPAQAVSGILLASSNGQCQCLETAATIVEKHLALRPSLPSQASVDHRVVYTEIENQIKKHPEVRCSQSLGGAGVKLAGACNHHAPAVFDIMLQQLTRYS